MINSKRSAPPSSSKRETKDKTSPKHSTIRSSEPTSIRHYVSHPSKTDTCAKSQKTWKSIRLSDLMASMYPGIKIGHKYCVPGLMLVPKTMGWLWNTEDTTTGVPFPRGWRPGAIALGIKKKLFRPRSVSEPLSTPIGSKGKKFKKKIKTTSSTILKSRTCSYSSVIEEHLVPTLRVEKEGGIFCVKMHPIKDVNANDAADEENPVQFKIAEHSISSRSRSSKSSLKIEYMCTGALRKPIKKPELAEMGTQWDTLDFQKKEPEKKEEIKQEELKEGKKKENKGKKKDGEKNGNKDAINLQTLENKEKDQDKSEKNIEETKIVQKKVIKT